MNLKDILFYFVIMQQICTESQQKIHNHLFDEKYVKITFEQ